MRLVMGLVLTVLGVVMDAAGAVSVQEGPGLSVAGLYHAVHRPVMIDVALPEAYEFASLALLDGQGHVLLLPATIHGGRVDLAAAMPDIWRLRRAGFLQLLIDEQPVGTPLVIEPLLSRMIPITEETTNPDGVTYTRITGWYDEHHPPGPNQRVSPGVRDAGVSSIAEAENPIARSIARPEEVNQRLISGLRVYPERDVIMHTSLGDVRLSMRPDAAPNTVWNFLTLCEGGFYDETIFHRVVALTRDGDPFVIQGGDPTGEGSGGAGYWLPLEPSDLPHDFGVISMARDVPPDSASSQFFICLSRAGTARLDGNYCSFGYAVEGAETILAIADVEIAIEGSGTDRPVHPPVVEGVSFVQSPPRTPGEGRPDSRVAVPKPEPVVKPARVDR